MSENGFGEGDRFLQLGCGELLVGGSFTAIEDVVPTLTQEIIEDDALKAVVIADGKASLFGKLGRSLIGEFKVAAAKLGQIGHACGWRNEAYRAGGIRCADGRCANRRLAAESG